MTPKLQWLIKFCQGYDISRRLTQYTHRFTLCHNFVETCPITLILVSFDAARRALSNELSFVYSKFGFRVRNLVRVRDSTFSKSEFRFVISIFFYPRKPLFLIFKLFFRRDHNSPGLPGFEPHKRTIIFLNQIFNFRISRSQRNSSLSKINKSFDPPCSFYSSGSWCC